ncbi:MAG: AAA family ATPase [Clostridia bacterium]|nr:AAA family ATPase [Clostridia bacterium]
MRLLECYIENFGKLSSFKYTFSEGLNVIDKDNGFGKTTLSVFIKSMLYGLDATKKTKIEENDRKHYLPWQGGVCGGWLTFSVGALSYKIERTFGQKAADDTFTLYELESGRVSYAYPENVGEKLFGIDEDGFERTVFLSERRLSVKNENETVSAKLSNLVGYEFDLGELDNALGALDERRKYYYKRGGGGRIGEINARIVETDAEISRISRIRERISESEAKIKEYEREIREGEKRLGEYDKKARTIADEKTYLEKRDVLLKEKEKLDESRRFFLDDIPSAEEIESAAAAKDEYRRLEARLDATADAVEKHESISAEISLTNGYRTYLAENKTTSSRALPISLFLIGVLLGVGGIIALSLSVIPLAIALLALLPICAGAGIVCGIRASRGAGESDRMRQEIKAHLNKHGRSYATPGEYEDELERIVIVLAKELESSSVTLRERDSTEAKYLALKNQYDSFISRFNVQSPDPILEVHSNLRFYNHERERVRAMETDLALYARENGVDVQKLESGIMPDVSVLEIDPRALAERINYVRSQNTIEERVLRSAVEELTRLDELTDERASLAEALAAAELNYNTILYTREHLIKARDSLTAKYLGKTREAFAKYLDMLTDEEPELFTMAVDFGVTKSESGISRPTEAFSLGTRDLYSIAARLALIDSLYELESPFIVLDDPFVHLDDKKCQVATKALKRLADRRQIIYFTCSKSREI